MPSTRTSCSSRPILSRQPNTLPISQAGWPELWAQLLANRAMVCIPHRNPLFWDRLPVSAWLALEPTGQWEVPKTQYLGPVHPMAVEIYFRGTPMAAVRQTRFQASVHLTTGQGAVGSLPMV